MLCNRLLLMNTLVRMDFKIIFLFLYPIGLALSIPILNQASTVESATTWFFLKCPLHFFTGWLCPTCGMTRSFVAILRGEWIAAINYHPLGPLLFIVLFLYWFLLIFHFDLVTASKKWYQSHTYMRRPLWWVGLSFVLWGFSRNFN